MLPEQRCPRCGRRMFLYRCASRGCSTERRVCVVCECGGIRPPVPFTTAAFAPGCHRASMTLVDIDLSYS